jgi:hypothetical protein
MPDLLPVLDVVIGFAFIFVLMSLVATSIQEYIAALFRLRSKHLANIIENLLDPSTEKLEGVKKVARAWESGIGDELIAKLETNAVKAFYEHPIIKGASATIPGKSNEP